MPVYDYTYRSWEGARRGPLFRWLAIVRFAYLDFFSKRLFIWMFTMAWAQFLLRLAYSYVLVNEHVRQFLGLQGQALGQALQINAVFFKNMIDIQLFFAFAFAFQMGAGLISRDLRHNAIVLYMSKPISWWEYFLGKFVTLFGLFMLLTWVQTLLLFVLQVFMAPPDSPWRTHFWSDYAWIAGAITLYATVVSATIALLILAASSLTRNARYAGGLFAMYLIGSSMVAGMVAGILGRVSLLALSPFYSGVQLGAYLFGVAGMEGNTSQPLVWASLLVVCAISFGIVAGRIRQAARFIH